MTYTAFRVLRLPLVLPELADAIPEYRLVGQFGPALMLPETCTFAVHSRRLQLASSPHDFGFCCVFECPPVTGRMSAVIFSRQNRWLRSDPGEHYSGRHALPNGSMLAGACRGTRQPSASGRSCILRSGTLIPR